MAPPHGVRAPGRSPTRGRGPGRVSSERTPRGPLDGPRTGAPGAGPSLGRRRACHVTFSFIPLAHLVSTLLMAGVIVYVQVVHYPLMSRVGPERFADYERGHTSRTGLVVIPLMLVELGTALWLVAVPPAPTLRITAWIGAGLLVVIWLSTATLQAPAHGRLALGFDARVHRRLVVSNWIRTVAWVGRIPVAVALAA